MARPRLEIGTWGKIGYIHEDNNVRAYASYRFADGVTRKRERSGATETQARRNLLRYLRTLGGNDDTLSRTSQVKSVALAWLKEIQRTEKVSTYRQYKTVADRHIIPLIGALQLNECKVARLQETVIDRRREEGYSHSMLCQMRLVMRHLFAYAVFKELMDYNPARDLKRIKKTDRKRILAFVDTEELQDFLAAVDADEHTRKRTPYLPYLIRMLFATGCRIGEVLAIRRSDMNLTDRPVRVTHAVFGDQIIPPGAVWINGNIVHGIGGVVRHDGKTDGSEAILILPQFAIHMLRFMLPAEGNPEDPIFPSPRGGYRGPNGVMQVIRGLRQRIGAEQFTSKWGRKTVATFLKMQGLSPEDVKDQLRHSNVATSEKHYIARVANTNSGTALDRMMTPVVN